MPWQSGAMGVALPPADSEALADVMRAAGLIKFMDAVLHCRKLFNVAPHDPARRLSIHPGGARASPASAHLYVPGRCARKKLRTWRTASGTRSFGSFQGYKLTCPFGDSMADSMATA